MYVFLAYFGDLEQTEGKFLKDRVPFWTAWRWVGERKNDRSGFKRTEIFYFCKQNKVRDPMSLMEWVSGRTEKRHFYRKPGKFPLGAEANEVKREKMQQKRVKRDERRWMTVLKDRIGRVTRFSGALVAKVSIGLLVVAGLSPAGLQAAPGTKPVVWVLATGGTIAGQGESQVAAAYKPGTLRVEELLGAIPELAEVAEVRAEQFAQIASQNMDVATWLKLAARINELLADPAVAGVVVTHGTDTQEETAYFLNLTLKSDKPVVMASAMRPPSALGSDGSRNLYHAVVCAASPQAVGQGVMIVMDDKIIGADDATKVSTLDAGAFQDPDYGPLGIIYDGRPIFSRRSLKRHTLHSEFDVSGLDSLPRVEVVSSYAGATALFIHAAVRAGVRGIVIAGVGNGNMSAEMQNAAESAREQGVAIVRSSRIMRGPTTQWNEVDDDKLGFVASWYANPYRARILLMLALTRTDDYREIQRMFTQY